MPNTKSAKKALRQNLSRRKRNLSQSNEAKTVIKNYKRLVSQGKKEDAAKILSTVYQKLDKLSKTGIIKKGRASRLKSRLSKKLSAQNS